MSELHDTMMEPRIEELLTHATSKFRLITLGAKRARGINDYYNALGKTAGGAIPPQVTSTAHKPLTMAFEEIAAEKIVPVESEDELPEVVEEVADDS